MQTVLIVIHIMVVIALITVVLLQRSEGGALGIGGGGGFMTGRGQANVLTRATAILAGLFFATSLGLTVLANVNRAPKSILENVTPPGTSAPAPAAPKGQGTLLEQLQKLQEQRQEQRLPPAANEGSAPSVPAPTTPASPAPPKSQ